MNVRVAGQIVPPGMQNTHQSDLAANETQAFPRCFSRNSEEQVVQQALVAANSFTQRRRHGKSQHEIWHRQEQISLRFRPFQGFVVLEHGAVPVTAGMITVLHLAALRTCIDLPAQAVRAALLDGAHRLPVARQDLI